MALAIAPEIAPNIAEVISMLIFNAHLSFVYYTKKRQDVANLLSTGEENKGLSKGGGGDKNVAFLRRRRQSTFTGRGQSSYPNVSEIFLSL
jgi:hypothetical protein